MQRWIRVFAIIAFNCALLSPIVVDGAAATRNRTVVEFKRKLNTCDDRDKPISVGTTRVVYSYNNQNTPSSDSSIAYHGPDTRGAKSLRLRSAASPVPLPADAQSFSITHQNRDIPFGDPTTGNKTTYYCKTFQLPIQQKKVHIVKAEPVITPGLYGRVHHMLVYACNELANNTSLLGWEGHCYADTTPQLLKQCNGGTVISGWAVGGIEFYYPPQAGLPVGTDYIQYVLMEVHYDNPNQIKIVDSSGMKYTYTPTLRPHDAGILQVGIATDPKLFIPPQQANFKHTGICPSQCTQGLPSTGLNVIATLLHAHTSGRSIALRHIRNDVELEPILTDTQYDFNFQDFETFSTSKMILPGDMLQVDCTYDTSARSANTYFGLTTQNEMCITYSVYYPALPLNQASCAYDNVSWTGIPQYDGEYYMCQGNSFKDIPVNKTYIPFTSNCTRVAPDNNRVNAKYDHKGFDKSRFNHSEQLDSDTGNNKYTMYWNVDEGNQEIHVALDVQSVAGWVGFGISGNGNMAGSDVSIGYIADDLSSVHHADRMADQHALPPLDDLQDYYDVVFYTNSVDELNVANAAKSGDGGRLGIDKLVYMSLIPVTVAVLLLGNAE